MQRLWYWRLHPSVACQNTAHSAGTLTFVSFSVCFLTRSNTRLLSGAEIKQAIVSRINSRSTMQMKVSVMCQGQRNVANYKYKFIRPISNIEFCLPVKQNQTWNVFSLSKKARNLRSLSESFKCFSTPLAWLIFSKILHNIFCEIYFTLLL